MSIVKLGVAVSAAFAVSACATVTKGRNDTVTFDSQPRDAAVSWSDTNGKLAEQSCKTPCTVEINRKWTYNVTFEKEGYQPVEALLEPKLSGDGTAGMAGNILLGGVVGAAVDGSTGAMNDLKPNPMIARLIPAGSGEPSYIVISEEELEAIESVVE